MKKRIIVCFIALMLIPFYVNAAAIAPATQDIVAKRGETVKAQISIINSSAIEQTYYLGAMKFVPKAETGSPQFISYDEDHSGLTEWIKFPSESVKVPSNSKGDVEFEIQIPEIVASGGYYSAVTVSSSKYDLVASNGSIIEAKTAALILLTVEGETTEKAELLNFSKKGRISSLFNGFSYRIQNQGNVHIVPEGEIVLKGLLGRVIKRIDANKALGRVLPNSTREYSFNEEKNSFWNTASGQMKEFAIGPIKAELQLSYADGSSKLTARDRYWYLPYQLIAVIAGSILILIGVFSLLSKKRK